MKLGRQRGGRIWEDLGKKKEYDPILFHCHHRAHATLHKRRHYEPEKMKDAKKTKPSNHCPGSGVAWRGHICMNSQKVAACKRSAGVCFW